MESWSMPNLSFWRIHKLFSTLPVPFIILISNVSILVIPHVLINICYLPFKKSLPSLRAINSPLYISVSLSLYLYFYISCLFYTRARTHTQAYAYIHMHTLWILDLWPKSSVGVILLYFNFGWYTFNPTHWGRPEASLRVVSSTATEH